MNCIATTTATVSYWMTMKKRACDRERERGRNSEKFGYQATEITNVKVDLTNINNVPTFVS